MKTRTKALLLVMSALLLVVSTVFATMAYLTSKTEVVKNTFTVGNVQITLDEAKVDEYGVKADPEVRVSANTYKLLPGHTYVKDPTVTVVEKSEQCYVRMQVTVTWKDGVTSEKEAIDVLKEAMPTFVADDGVFLLQNLVDGWDNTTWLYNSYNNGTYEFWYNEVVDARENEVVLDALFDAIVIPGDIDNDTLATLNNIEINVVAYAIQADGFADADAAWAAWPTNP